MNKKEFISISLPYNLKCTGVTEVHEYQLLSLHIGSIELCRVKPCEGGIDFPLPINDIKPILRPLSDLTKEIKHKGLKFIPITILKEMNDGDNIYISEFGVSIDNGYAAGYNLGVAFTFIQKLVEWHFDICGLIEKGEAIDYQTRHDFIF